MTENMPDTPPEARPDTLSDTGRRFLVIVRAGDKSLHPAWLAGAGPRNWDLIVNYYGDDPALYRRPDVLRIDSKGPKWPALHDVIRAHPALMARYSHVWLPDDDLAVDLAGINLLFETCVRYGLEMAQPALTWDSYSTHLVTLQHTNSIIRYTNFVEIMGPCFSASMLAKSLPLFATNLSGWGLDFMWTKLADNPDTGVAIIDTVAVRHTRPIGGPNYKTLRAQGISPLVELRAFCRQHGIDPKIVIHKSLDRHGRPHLAAGRERRFAMRQLLGCVAALRYAPDRYRVARRIVKTVIRTATNQPYRIVDLAATSL